MQCNNNKNLLQTHNQRTDDLTRIHTPRAHARCAVAAACVSAQSTGPDFIPGVTNRTWRRPENREVIKYPKTPEVKLRTTYCSLAFAHPQEAVTVIRYRLQRSLAL